MYGSQYLSKFLPHLSDITKPLRELTRKETEWMWDHPQQKALDNLKQAVTSTPVLRYYHLKEEVTLQCDASQGGLGAALLQNGQPVAYASLALTATETHYAQIEKELLAIVFACNHFDPYIYGREGVHVQTDHKPLETIMLKPLNSAPARLQRMLLNLQKYSLDVKYLKGDQMFLADTLSRAYLPTSLNACDFEQTLETVDHTATLAVEDKQLQQIVECSQKDPVMQTLKETVLRGWPESKTEVPECIHTYYDVRDELTVQGHMIFKGQRLVIPQPMRKEMMALAHATHIGIEGCIRRARESMYWPRMSTELKEYIAKCDTCLSHRAMPSKEPLKQHEYAARPWSKVSADLCQLSGRTLLVVCDYYSNYIEVDRVHKVNTAGVTKVLRPMFARYGIPDTLMTDNGPQFDSAEFSTFAKKWGFKHDTSSPRYPQSNGKAENAVKTVKWLFTKCQETGQSEYLALLDWRNTPTEGLNTSPAQRLLGRRCKTRLPITESLLEPQFSTKEDMKALQYMKQRQKHYYDRQARPLKLISPGDTVRMKLPSQDTWSAGTCIGLAGPRSYDVQVGGRQYRRNRRHLIPAQEVVPSENSMEEESRDLPDEPRPAESPADVNPLQRSTHNTNPPAWMNDYVRSDQ